MVPLSKPWRIAVLATHPIQYQTPLWRYLAADKSVDVHVFFGSDLSVRGYRDAGFGVQVRWDGPMLEGYRHTFLNSGPSAGAVTFGWPRATGLFRHFQEFEPDVVLLTGYFARFWFDALMVSRCRGIPIVMRHEASDVAVARSRWKARVRRVVVRSVYSQIHRFAAIGTSAREHLLAHGVAPARIGWAPYCVDSEALEAQVQTWLPQRAALRAKLGIAPTDLGIVFSGKLIDKKHPLLIPQALARLSPEVLSRVHLLVLGDGEQRAELVAQATAILGNRLHMAGFVNQSELGRWYAAADCLVLPSRQGAGETWGLVVNEALQFGLPAIVSAGVGCHRDLVIENETGNVFADSSAAELAGILAKFATLSEAPWKAYRQKTRALARVFSLPSAGQGLLTELKTTAASGNR